MNLLTLNEGTALFLALATLRAIGLLSNQPEPENLTRLHILSTVLGLAGFSLIVSAPFTSVGFRTQAAAGVFVFLVATGGVMLGDIGELGEVRDATEDAYQVPDSPEDILEDDQ